MTNTASPARAQIRAQIRALSCEAFEAMDYTMVAVCDIALKGEWYPDQCPVPWRDAHRLDQMSQVDALDALDLVLFERMGDRGRW